MFKFFHANWNTNKDIANRSHQKKVDLNEKPESHQLSLVKEYDGNVCQYLTLCMYFFPKKTNKLNPLESINLYFCLFVFVP